MEYTKEELIEAKRQIDSTLHKLRETIKTLQDIYMRDLALYNLELSLVDFG